MRLTTYYIIKPFKKEMKEIIHLFYHIHSIVDSNM